MFVLLALFYWLGITLPVVSALVILNTVFGLNKVYRDAKGKQADFNFY